MSRKSFEFQTRCMKRLKSSRRLRSALLANQTVRRTRPMSQGIPHYDSSADCARSNYLHDLALPATLTPRLEVSSATASSVDRQKEYDKCVHSRLIKDSHGMRGIP